MKISGFILLLFLTGTAFARTNAPYRLHIQNFDSTKNNSIAPADSMKEPEPPGLQDDGKEFEDKSSLFTLDLLNQTHDHYRGRDEGLNQYSFYPTIKFQHSSGFGIYASFNFLSGSQSSPDDAELGISYTYDFNDVLSTTLYLSHYWFGDSSTSARQALSNSIGAEFDFDFGYVNFSAIPNLDFSKSASEVSLFLTAAAPVRLSRNFLYGKISMEPSISTVIGDQADAGRTPGNIIPFAKGKNKFLSKSFSVLDYEMGLALQYQSRYVNVQPEVDYIIPMNITDVSSKKGFVSFILEIEIPFKFKF